MGHFGNKVFSVQELCDNRHKYHGRGRPQQLTNFLESFVPLMKDVANGKTYTREEIITLPYFKYLESRLSPRDKGRSKGTIRVIRKVKDAIKLFYDIRDYGLKSPLDMIYRSKNSLYLARGSRRLVIINILGHDKVVVRTYKNRDVFNRYAPMPKWAKGHADNFIWDLAAKQFAQLGIKSTDKYRLHNYIPLYDRHIGHLRPKKNCKILELGVYHGASLLLWKEAFPKAQIFGLDKNTAIWQELLKDQDRIKVFVGRQENDEFMQSVVNNGPYDIIIDDASHAAEMQQRMLKLLWPVCTSVYVIEDLRSGSYLKRLKRPKGVPRTTDVLKKYVDIIHKKDEIRCMSHYYDICFLEKL